MFAFGLIIPLLSFILQIWPRLINRYFGVDTWRHLLLADYVRKYHRLPTELKQQYIFSSGNPGYPPVIYLILSIFPKKFAEKYQFIFSPLFDALHNYLIFYFSLLLTHNLQSALFAQGIAALTPIAVIEASNLSTRVLSYLVFSLCFFPLLMFVVFHMYIWLVVAYIMLLVLFLTHKFAIQSFLFNAIGFSIVEKNPFYILFFMSAFIFMIIFLGKIYKPILREHLSILNFWIKNIDVRFIHQFRGQQKAKEVSDFVHKLLLLSVKNPYIYILGNNPWIGIFLIFAVLSFTRSVQIESTIIDCHMLSKLPIWIWVSVIIAILTFSIKKLRFLGEGNRYLEYSIFPLSILLGSYIPFLLRTYGVLLVLGMVTFFCILLISIVYIQVKVILKDRMRTITSELWDCIKYLNDFGEKARVAIFPLQFGDALTYFIKGKVLTTYNNAGLARLADIYPVVKIPIDELISKFKLNFILFDENHVTLQELGISKYSIIKRGNGYILLKV